MIVAHLGVLVWAGSFVSGGASESTSVLMSVHSFNNDRRLLTSDCRRCTWLARSSLLLACRCTSETVDVDDDDRCCC